MQISQVEVSECMFLRTLHGVRAVHALHAVQGGKGQLFRVRFLPFAFNAKIDDVSVWNVACGVYV
jgi:hypothetical protein